MDTLTARQTQVLELIRQWIDTTGYPPTRADIADALGFRSANAAEEHLRALAKKGAIEMIAGASRGIRLIAANHGLPVVGHVAAGYPVLAEEHIGDYCDVPANLFNPRADYLLRVRGMSMKDAGILEDDLLAVHKVSEAPNGRIVVARLGDEVTVKRLKKTRSRFQIVLMPENPDFEPIEVDLRQRECVIEGISVGVIRR